MDQLRKMRRKVWLLQNITSEPTSMCDDALITESWAAERSAWHLRNYISLGTYISYIPLISSWYLCNLVCSYVQDINILLGV